MPFKSKSQRGYMWLHHPKIAKEFERKTLDIKSLPNSRPKKDGSGNGTRANRGRGGCSPTRKIGKNN